MSKTVLILAGDGIGPEVVAQAERVLSALIEVHGLELTIEYGLIGGAAIDATGVPFPDETRGQADRAAAILLGAVGGPRWNSMPREHKPERGLLALRAGLDCYANLRPVVLYDALIDASSLKPEIIGGLDIMIVRELIGGIYFGEPRGIGTLDDGQREGVNTLRYSESEIERIAHVAFSIAMKRDGKVTSVDKANVLEATELWREVVTRVACDYPTVCVEHLYVDNAAMQLVRDPRQFDVILTTNMFGDILSDLASMLTGSIGMLPSASLNPMGQGLYEPIHGAAPDIAGQDRANPLAMILSTAMMLRHSLGWADQAENVERAVRSVLADGLRTPDIATDATSSCVSTRAMGDAIITSLGATP